ncbi:MAG: hypothetical protein QXS24_06510 [Desulfurococcaceae archaeon]
MSKLTPIYGLGFFFVRELGLIEQIIIFEYHDPLEEYRSIIENKHRLEDEKSMLKRNMQYFLDQETVKINNKQVYPRVIDVELGFKGDYSYPYIMFFIKFIGEFRKGINIYEDTYEPEIAEYDYRVYWFFPSKARVISADLGVPYSLMDHGRILSFIVNKNTRTKGYEKIEFEME